MTQGDTRGEKGTQGETRGHKGRQDPREAGRTPANKGKQGETKPSGRRTHHPTQAHMWGDSGRQWQTRERPEKADIPSQAHMWGDNGRQKGKTTRREGGPTIQHMGDNALNGTDGVRRGDKTLGRRTRHPTQAHMWGGNERQDVRKADAPSNTHMWEDNGKHWGTRGRQDIENANTSSNTGTHVGTRQRGKSGDKVPGRRTRQPTKRKHEGRHWVRDKGRQDQGESP